MDCCKGLRKTGGRSQSPSQTGSSSWYKKVQPGLCSCQGYVIIRDVKSLELTRELEEETLEPSRDQTLRKAKVPATYPRKDKCDLRNRDRWD